jgi:hypothetical protein
MAVDASAGRRRLGDRAAPSATPLNRFESVARVGTNQEREGPSWAAVAGAVWLRREARLVDLRGRVGANLGKVGDAWSDDEGKRMGGVNRAAGRAGRGRLSAVA